MNPASKFVLVSVPALVCAQTTATASLIYLYDFPGGSGLASDQINGQPSNATFSAFTAGAVRAASDLTAYVLCLCVPAKDDEVPARRIVQIIES
jgi:hypothetical protein